MQARSVESIRDATKQKLSTEYSMYRCTLYNVLVSLSDCSAIPPRYFMAPTIHSAHQVLPLRLRVAAFRPRASDNEHS